ncbi:MAG TPA: TlpA disulfide reductase family protein [Acidimicrobiales bacterium]
MLLLGVAIIAVLAVLSFTGDGSHAGGVATPTAFDLPALQGSSRVRLAAYRGEPVVVTLFASWCTACAQELPAFATASDALRGKVQFIAVNSQETGNGPAFAAHYRLTQSGVVLAKDIGRSSTGGLYNSLGARGLPVTAFYSPSGAVLFKAAEGLDAAELHQMLQQYYGV